MESPGVASCGPWWGPLGRVLGASWGVGPPLGGLLGPFGSLLEVSWALLEPCHSRGLEMSVGPPPVWTSLGTVLGASWAVLGASWAVLGLRGPVVARVAWPGMGIAIFIMVAVQLLLVVEHRGQEEVCAVRVQKDLGAGCDRARERQERPRRPPGKGRDQHAFGTGGERVVSAVAVPSLSGNRERTMPR